MMSLENEILHLFVANKWTLATAESCTGGSIAARLTQVPGASQYFQGSIVAYSNDFKYRYLNVPQEIIQKYGAVSEEAVITMAEGLTKHVDFAIAISGIAGPSGGTEQKPVGTVWIAILRKNGKPVTKHLHLKGTRTSIIKQATDASLQLLYNTVF